MNDKVTYKDSGVDIHKGDALVEKIKQKVQKTYNQRVKSGVGGFACLYEVGDRFLAAGTDGVGTKLKLAFELNKHDTVGVDLVAMCVNDILCTGAKPLFFMDYLATGALDLNVNEAIVEGIVQGCLQSECALIGGETAEMPGMYQEGEYDLAGFAIGEVFADNILGGEKVKENMSLIALRSSGFHSNGFSLIRKVANDFDEKTKERLLTPTKIYWMAVKDILENNLATGFSHITGGGLLNLPRMNKNLDYKMSMSSSDWETRFYTDEMALVKNHANLSFEDMAQTFNCGVGLIMACHKDNEVNVLESLKRCGEEGIVIGSTEVGSGAVVFEDCRLK